MADGVCSVWVSGDADWNEIRPKQPRSSHRFCKKVCQLRRSWANESKQDNLVSKINKKYWHHRNLPCVHNIFVWLSLWTYMAKYKLNTRVLRKGDIVCISGGPNRRSFQLDGKRITQTAVLKLLSSLGVKATKHCTKSTRLIIVPDGIKYASPHKQHAGGLVISLYSCLRRAWECETRKWEITWVSSFHQAEREREDKNWKM